MTGYRLSAVADQQVDEIYAYSREQWGATQALNYLSGLFDCFTAIGRGDHISRSIPAEYAVAGFYARYRNHHIYWRRRTDGSAYILAILHQSMHQSARLKDDL
ncbi:type II toxin-antitoxin system RelE/ParE family toxin [Sphingomonas crocodyli]|uniref:Type II toxin-antitoxin system RelE/ParE family toxin n=1 Tax=Sphingomonas crocodyli TaxID=1979270 RepID=A0A437LUY9_9SPHN|nr:type II toxin-antitoxin system RelE/ParE family toxin [Sphingomonas crocodyli]RVT89113.1 type II toxin-antitoxin system RelE/ParE family toxin [Sphingomonas crocodyli]